MEKSTIEALKRVDAYELYRSFVKKNLRPDGRTMDKNRIITITNGESKNMNGSSIVRLGSTFVICGIKAEITEPTVEKNNMGFLIPNVDLSPICSPNYRPGPPPDSAQVLSETIFKILNVSKIIDLKGLCIEPDKAVWVLYADVVCLNDDGNVLDAAFYSILAALQNTKLPGVEYEDEEGLVYLNQDLPKTLNILNYPIPISFGIFDHEHILIDPSSEEESILSSKFTVLYNQDGNLISFLKHGGSSISADKLSSCFQQAKERSKEILRILGPEKRKK